MYVLPSALMNVVLSDYYWLVIGKWRHMGAYRLKVNRGVTHADDGLVLKHICFYLSPLCLY